MYDRGIDIRAVIPVLCWQYDVQRGIRGEEWVRTRFDKGDPADIIKQYGRVTAQQESQIGAPVTIERSVDAGCIF